MMPDQISQIASDTVEILVALGHYAFVRDNAGGGYRIAPSVERLTRDRSGKHLAITLDLSRLPRGVSLAALKAPDTVKSLALHLGKPVKVLNGSGLVYVVELKPALAARLAT